MGDTPDRQPAAVDVPPERSERPHGGGGGHGGGSSGRWMVSYADFITLMMVVFMVLYSMAKVDNAKFNQLKASLSSSSIGGTPIPVGGNPVNTAPVQPGPDPDSAPGHLNPVNPSTAVSSTLPVVTPAQTDTTSTDKQAPASSDDKEATPDPAPSKPAAQPSSAPSTPAEKPATDTTIPRVTTGLKATGAAAAGQLSVKVEDRGVVVTILTSVLFNDGTADLKPGASALLDQIAPQLKLTGDSVLVEGSPDASLKDAPYDLASRRASVVSSYLSGTGISPDRFSVIGYGKGAGVNGIVNVVVLRKQ